MSTLHPVLLVGLGSPGVDMARDVARQLANGSGELAPLVRVLALDHAGLYVVEPSEGTVPASHGGAPRGPGMHAPPIPGDHPAPDQAAAAAEDDAPPPPGAAAPPAPPALVEFTLCLETGGGVWRENAGLVSAQHAGLTRAFAAQVRGVRAYEVVAQRQRSRNGGRVGEQVHVVLYTSMDDPVGSAALIPVLAAFEDVFQLTLADISRTVQPVLFFPDLGGSGTPQAYARAYACMRELEVALETGSTAHRPVHADRVWLLSSRNADDFFVESHGDLVPVLAGHLAATVRGLLWDEPSPIPALHRHVQGRRSRYGTFGVAKLVFPRDQLLRAAVDWAVGEALQQFPVIQPLSSSTDELAAFSADFLNEHGLRDVARHLRKTADGAHIFRPFEPPRPPPEPGLGHDGFCRALAEAYAVFEQTDAETTPMLTRRADDLRARVLSLLDDSVAERLRSGQGGVWAAQAWTATLTGNPPDFVGVDGGRRPETLPGAIDRVVFAYFEPRWEQDGKRDPSSQPRRDRKRRLEQEHASKLRQLKLVQHQMESLSRSGAEAEGTSRATRQAAAFNETSYDANALRASREASDAHREEGLQIELTVLRAREAGLTDEVAKLAEEVVRVSLELEDLEATVRDPDQRGALFERYRQHVVKETASDEENHDRAAREVQNAFTAWNRAYERARKWAFWICGTAVPLAITALFLLPPLLLVVSAAAWGVFEYVVGAPLRAARRVLLAKRDARDAIRRRIEQRYAELATTVFEHTLHSQLADFGERITWYVRTDLEERIRSFGNGIMRLGQDAAKRAGELDLPDRREVGYVLPPGGAEEVVAPHRDGLRAATHRVLRQMDVPGLFAAYRKSPAVLGQMEDQVREACLHALDSLTTCTLNEFLAQLYPEPRDRVARVEQFHRAAAPFGKLAFSVADDPSMSQAVLSVSGAPPANSIVAQALRGCGCNALALEAHDETEASLLRLTTGFASFQFAGVGEAREEFIRLTTEERAACSTTEADGELLPDLFPPRLREGGPDPGVRTLAEQALAQGLACGRDGIALEYERIRFPSVEAWVAFLDGPSGVSMLRQLQVDMAGAVSSK